MDNIILKQIEAYIVSSFQMNSLPFLYYHNLAHTLDVVNHCHEIGTAYNLKRKELLLLLSAAWFHDIGHLYTDPESHEEKSSEVMRGFLDNICEPKTILEIERLIITTKYPPQPNSLLEQIICDADTYHFGTHQFLQTDPMIKKEMESRTGLIYQNWKSQSLQMLRLHQFYTAYCRERLEKGKHENIKLLESQV
jgi:predicted metal-dependent HD superfamily phosphohydrolase